MVPAEQVIARLRERGQSLSTCESLTAGLLAATLAEVPGASAVLRGGLITYATDLKERLAGVEKQTLVEHGPVSAETAAEMAAGARRVCGSDWALSLTGVAGPEPQDGHPVGEVFLGLARPDGSRRVVRVKREGKMRYALSSHESVPVAVLVGGRTQIRSWAVAAALELIHGELGENGE
ncbi:MAG TPA: CinA family protein [Corynebacterium sp.]|nr:CinA family protein [Corynebacterium sp.]